MSTESGFGIDVLAFGPHPDDVEIFCGGVMILAGFLARPVAFLLAGEMAVAYFTVHQKSGGLPIQNHGEAAALFCFTFLFFATHGGVTIDPDGPGPFFEVPVVLPLPETLSFIP